MTLLLGLMAAGLPGRLLLPAHWSELADGLDRGLAGVEGVEWPYAGPELWIRRTVLLGAPALLAVGATLAFWPARRATTVLRAAGLVALLLLYGSAVAEHDPGQPALRGLVLLMLVGAWLWLPRLPRREAGIAAAVVASVGILSVPLAAALDADNPWWDYRGWNLFGGGEVIRFDWTHSYGPLDWSRAGATVMNVKSDRPHYWKAETLDAFDGLRWGRSTDLDDTRYGTQVAYTEERIEGRWNYNEYNLEWDERIRFTVRSLSSQFVVGAGVVLDVDGVGARYSSDGTIRLPEGERLEEGDAYSVRAYAPNPTKEQMQGVYEGYDENLVRYTEIHLPNPGDSAIDDAAAPAFVEPGAERENVFVPLRGSDPSASGRLADRSIRNSPYLPMYQQARELTDNAPTAYDAVKNVEQWLQNNFRYAERVPSHDIPLMGFIEEDKRGYCQQFSGAMALMLRMSGIPARVAAGFSPGSYNKDTREYRVRDLDAHSWVEVWFTGIGWVPFDPTPERSPAQSQSSALATSAAAADAGEVRAIQDGASASDGAAAAGSELGSDSGGGWVAARADRAAARGPAGRHDGGARRPRAPRPHAGAGCRRGRAAVRAPPSARPARLGPAGSRRPCLGSSGGSGASPARPPRRTPAPCGRAATTRARRQARALRERRALRRELTRGSALDRLMGFLAIPPGAPRS